MQSLSLTKLGKMFLQGSLKIIENKEIINAINIFPVPDSDTGSNMSNTLMPFKELLLHNTFLNINDFRNKALKTALVASQGNSGMLFTSWMEGFLQALDNKEDILVTDLANAFSNGAKLARKSVGSPIKGTMLDVIDACVYEFSKYKTLISAFKKSLIAVEKALRATEEHMKLLHDHHVVDAGALGWSYFFAGMTEEVLNEKIMLKVHDLTVRGEIIGNKNSMQYEVIFLLEKPEVSQEEIFALFSSLGDSLDTIAIEEKIKVHIHTNQPGEIEAIASTLGKIINLKTTNMLENNL